MTREEILAMPAGPELDALVAERVMRWFKACNLGDGPCGVPLDCWHVGEWPGKCVQYQSRAELTEGGWAPSRDLTDAWQIIEMMRHHFCCVEIKSDWHYVWDVVLTKDEEPHVPFLRVHNESLPLAICRAALLTTLDPS